jgi:hypothetical protein
MKQRAKSAEATGCLTTPFTPDQFVKVINKVLAR